MKVLFVIDYYAPFNPGGSEWSVYYLAKSFLERGVEVKIITPNYGAKEMEVVDGIEVVRFKSYPHLKSFRSVVNPVWQNNPVFFLWSSLMLYQFINKEKIDIVHVQGKFLIPGAVIASKLLKKPVFVSLRDKQLLCSYGKCFFEKGRFKACGWKEYLLIDMPWFYKNYIKTKNVRIYLYTVLAAIWTRIAYKVIWEFVKRADQVIAISKSQKKYLQINGMNQIKVIYNSVIISRNKPVSKRSGVLFVGKLSLGKGVFAFLGAIPLILKKVNQKFVLAGGVDAKDEIDHFVKQNNLQKNINFLDGVSHQSLASLYEKSLVTVMPSIYPEAFGRVALESLAFGTPVVVSDRGGLPEIVENKVTGIICEPESQTIAKAVISIIKNNKNYVNNINKKKESLIKKFEVDPIEQHLKLYKEYLR